MRTSGASSDPLALVPLFVAVGAVVMLAGGPGELLLAMERMLRNFVDVAGDWARLLTG